MFRRSKLIINRKLLVVSILVVFISAVSVHFLRVYQLTRQGGFYLSQAKKAVNDGEFAAAADHFRKAATIDPRNFEVHAELAKCFDSMNAFGEAFNSAQRAEQLKIDDEENARLLIKLTMKLGRFDDAVSRLVALVEQNEKDASLVQELARAYVGKRDYSNAEASFKKAIAIPAAPASAYVEYADLMNRDMKRLDESLEILNKLVLRDKTASPSYILRGKWILNTLQKMQSNVATPDTAKQLKWIQLAKQDEIDAKRLGPESIESLDLSIKLLLYEKRFDVALDESLSAIKKFPTELDFYLLAVSVASLLQQGDVAQKALVDGLTQFPNEPQLLWELANKEIREGRAEDCRKMFTRLTQANIPAPAIDYLEAKCLRQEGKYVAAIAKFETARGKFGATPETQSTIDIELSDLAGNIGDSARQIALLERVISANPNKIELKEKLASAFIAAKRFDKANEVLAVIAGSPGATRLAAINLVRVAIGQTLETSVADRDWEKILTKIRALNSVGVSLEEIRVWEASVLGLQGKTEQARNLLEDLPQEKAVLLARISVEVAAKDFERADELIAKAKSKGMDGVDFRQAIATRLMAEGISENYEKLKSLLENTENWSTETKAQLLKTIMISQVAAGLDNDAEKTAEKVLLLSSTDLATRSVLLEIYFRAKNADSIAKVLGDIESRFGKTAVWHYGKALETIVNSDSTSLEKSQIEAVQLNLAEAISQRPDWAEPVALSGNIDDNFGNHESAINKYRQAVDLGYDRLDLLQRLLVLLTSKGRFSDADAVLRKMSQSSNSLPSEVSRLGSEVNFRLSNLQRSITLAKTAASNSHSSDDYLWLAQLYEIAKDERNAEQSIRDAIQHESMSFDARFALIRFLCFKSRLDEAKELLTEYKDQIDTSVPLQSLSLAECFDLVGSPNDSKETLERIRLNAFSETSEYDRYFGLFCKVHRREQQRECLENAIRMSDSNPSLKKWAKLRLAFEISKTPNTAELDQAINMLSENLAEEPKSIDNRRALAVLLTMRDGVRFPNSSLEIYEGLLEEGWIPTFEDLFLIGQLYVAKNDWAKGNRYLMQVVSAKDKRQPWHVRRYVEILLERKDTSDAELWIDSLRKAGDRDLRTATLLADVRFQRGQFDKLLSVLTANASNDSEATWFAEVVSPRDRAIMLSLYMTKLKKSRYEKIVQQFVTAVELIRKSFKDEIEFPVGFYAGQFVVQGDWEKAISEIEQFNERTPLSELTIFEEFVFRALKVNKQAILKIENVYAQLATKRVDSRQVRHMVARLKEAEGDYAGAINEYRLLLREEDQDVVSINNLANLMALRRQNPAEALSLAESSIQLKGPLPPLLDTRGVCCVMNGDLIGGIRDFSEAIRLSRDPLHRFHLAWAFSLQNDLEKSKQLLSDALKDGLSPSSLHPIERSLLESLKKLTNLR